MTPIDLLSFNWLAHHINNTSFLGVRGVIGGRVVDLGCGTAPYREDILEVANDYVGVDWPSSRHSAGRVDVFADLGSALPFGDRTADTVTCFQVMEHIAEPNVLLAEGFRILRPGGWMIVTVPFMWHVHEAPHDYYRYTRYGLGYLFANHGFVDIQITETTGFWQVWVLKLNYHTARWGDGLMRALLLPLWFAGQIVSPWLDRLDRHPEETGSYVAIARRPIACGSAS